MKKNYIMSTMILLFLFLLSSVAFADYNQTGNYNKKYSIDGIGFFNSEMDSDTTATRTLTNAKGVPLVSDLDNDGTDEIIVLDDTQIRLYHGKDLTIVDSYLTPFTYDLKYRSNMLTFDIDGDGKREIILADELHSNMIIVGYNGTDFYNKSEIGFSAADGINHYTGEIIIQCRSVNDCLMVYSDYMNTGAGRHLYASAFNSTDMKEETLLTDANGVFCTSRIPEMSVVDSDNDGYDEYITSWMDYRSISGDDGDDIHIYRLGVYLNGSIVKEKEYTETRTGNLGSTEAVGDCRDNNIGQFFTSPLVFDIDGSVSNGKEAVIGTMLDDNSYKMFSYTSDLATLDDYPELLESDGTIVSNVVLANTFTDTGKVDFCVMGFRNSDSFLVLTCASEQTGQSVESDQFDFDYSSLYNISNTADSYSNIIHSVDMSRATTDGNNLDEILTSYGVFSLDFEGLNELFLIYNSPVEDASIIASDPEKTGQNDLIALTDNNVWYIDDGFSNSGARISHYYIDPCIDAIWQLNTSVEVRITATDENGDAVSSKSVLYQGETNEQDSGYSNNLTSGAVFSFEFIANTTGSNSILGLYARDTINLIPDNIDLAYSVGYDGIVRGSGCVTDVTIDLTETETATEENDSLTPSENNNLIRNAVIEINVFFGIGLIAVWLLLIVLIDIFLIVKSHEYFKGWESKYLFSIIAGLDFLLIIVGAIFSIIPIWLIILLLILGIAIGVIFVVNKISGQGG